MHHKLCNDAHFMKTLTIPKSTVSQRSSKLRGTIVFAERRGLEMHYYIDNDKPVRLLEF